MCPCAARDSVCTHTRADEIAYIATHVCVCRTMTKYDGDWRCARRWYQVRVSVRGGQQQRPVVLSQTKSRYKAENLSSFGLNCRIGDESDDDEEAAKGRGDGIGTGTSPSNGASNGSANGDTNAAAKHEYSFYTDASRIRYTWESNALEHLVKFRLELPITTAVRRRAQCGIICVYVCQNAHNSESCIDIIAAAHLTDSV